LLTTNALNDLKQYIQKKVAYAKYKVGSTFYQAPIQKTEILTDGRVAIYVLIDHSVPGDITISQLQLYDTGGNVWLDKPESIFRRDLQEGVLIRITFNIQEV